MRLKAARSGLATPGRAHCVQLAPRASARARGYDARWDRASKQFLRSHPLCRGCDAVGRIEPSTLTDHVIPHRGDLARFWDRAWWQASCKWCHDVVKQVLERRFEAGEIEAADLWLDSSAARAARAATEGEGGSKV